MESPLCTLPLLVLLGAALSAQAQEICDNGVDDDANGLVDLNDVTPCACTSMPVGAVHPWLRNASFEQHTCVPAVWGQMSCASWWSQPTLGTPDYFTEDGFLPAGLPLPADGQGEAGCIALPDFREYLGNCLAQPLPAGVAHTLTMQMQVLAMDASGHVSSAVHYGPIDVTLFGSPTCLDEPLNTFACPQGFGWTELGHATLIPGPSWSTITIDLTPAQPIRSIMLGPPCDLPADYVENGDYFPYLLFDGLATDMPPMAVTVQDTGRFCANSRTLIAHPQPNTGDRQWYLNGVALVGRTDTVLPLSALGLGAGLYQLRVSLGDTACALFTWPVAEEVPPQVSAAFGLGGGCAPLMATFSAQAAIPGITGIQWNFGDGAASGSASGTHVYSSSGTYLATFEATAWPGCAADTVIGWPVVVHPVPAVPSFTCDPLRGCAPLNVAFTAGIPSNAELSCSWDLGDGTSSGEPNPVHTYTAPGPHSVTLTVTNPAGCSADSTMADLITVLPNPTAAFTSSAPIADADHVQQAFTNASSDDVITWAWTFDGGDPGWCITPDAHVVFPADGAMHAVELHVMNAAGCEGVARTFITARGIYELSVPNAFTPDGDGVNDRWRPIGTGLEPGSYELSIFDRWGAMIWATADVEASWDGSVEGAAPKTDCYVWHLAVRDRVSGQRHAFEGHVTVLP